MRTTMIIIAMLCLNACRIGRMDFTEDDIDLNYIHHLISVAGGYRPNTSPDPITGKAIDPLNKKSGPEDSTFSGIRVYRSVMEDALVVRDRLVTETIRSAGSRNRHEPEEFGGNVYRLYIIVSGERAAEAALLIPSIFDAQERCIGLGPAWIGTWGAGECRFYKMIRFKPGSGKQTDSNAVHPADPGKWIYRKKENESGRTHSIYTDPGFASRKISIRLVTDQRVNLNRVDSFTVTKIFRTSDSNIGGNKHLEFDLPEIFGDSSALFFTRIK